MVRKAHLKGILNKLEQLRNNLPHFPVALLKCTFPAWPPPLPARATVSRPFSRLPPLHSVLFACAGPILKLLLLPVSVPVPASSPQRPSLGWMVATLGFAPTVVLSCPVLWRRCPPEQEPLFLPRSASHLAPLSLLSVLLFAREPPSVTDLSRLFLWPLLLFGLLPSLSCF